MDCATTLWCDFVVTNLPLLCFCCCVSVVVFKCINNGVQTCIARAWDFSRPFVVAPAMNTHMWTHPHTAAHIAELERLRIRVVSPVAKRLACGDTGIGALAPVDSICAAVVEATDR